MEQESEDGSSKGQQSQEPVTLNCHVPKKKALKDDNHLNHEPSSQPMATTSSKINESNLTLTQREELALNALQEYIEGCGGKIDKFNLIKVSY